MMHSFCNFLRVLGKGKDQAVLQQRFEQDVELLYSDASPFDCPDEYPASVIETDWYINGGWAEVRRVAYGPWESQLEMQYDGTWTDYVVAVKARWPKP